MKYRTLIPITAGLLVSQVISAFLVWQSGLDLFRSMSAIKAAGYLPVPNEQVMPSLKEFLPAFCGGFFFTLSIGAALTLLTFAIMRSRNRISNRHFPIFPMIFWVCCLILANFRGFCFAATSFFIIIPLVVGVLSAKSEVRNEKPFSVRIPFVIAHLLLILLAIIGMSRMNINFFLNFRDNFLLSDSFGLRINDFYYKYTLYPAEVFKSASQKLLKTCKLRFEDAASKERIERLLLSYDYLSIEADIPADIEITQKEAEDFFKNPPRFLKNHSEQQDRHAFFRYCVWLSLIGMPFLIIYGCGFGVFRILSAGWRRSRRITGIGIGVCLLLTAFAIFHEKKNPMTAGNLSKAMISNDRQQRIEALKFVIGRGIEIADFDVSKTMSSPDIYERYCFVRTLGQSKSPKTFDMLIKLLDDPQPNIAYTAYSVLGLRKDARAIPEISKRLAISDNWYVQGYAYKALRRLGWSQSRSKQKPS